MQFFCGAGLMRCSVIPDGEVVACQIAFDNEYSGGNIKEKCICKTCPTYVSEESETAFCHPLISKSKTIKDERGCDCPKCPVYKMMKMKIGYYCTRKSEMEQEVAKKV